MNRQPRAKDLQNSAKNRVSNPMKNFTMLSVQLVIFMDNFFTFIDY